MKILIEKELDTLNPWSLPAFMGLWADEGTLCLEHGCFHGVDSIKEEMEGFFLLMSETCDMLDECYYMESVNRAACRFSCVISLKSNPGCTSDASHGIIVFEWNEEGLLLKIDDFLSNEAFTKSVAPCIKGHLRESSSHTTSPRQQSLTATE
eukprot:CAMPEP_0183777626 /NCGR_PEP_ID=MMETSP0739-20130205/49478_1 /TAXON_ID=385413 /ORGANISM="Thalassiosira miniscula, Strain CCMP1093" /LENGTH=151 /DNA_ID=CAMNT_0026019801 /DNA_START=150 /DNA_END=605 /DNA_ORIENTATION=-